MTSILFDRQKARVGLVNLDATVEETHTKTNELTDFPVDTGVSITDHIRQMPESIEINGIVSNTPIVFAASIQAPSPIEGDLTRISDRVEFAYEELRRIMNVGELVTVVTTLRTYENMALTGLAVTRNASTGRVLNATLLLREVLFAFAETVEAPDPVEPQNKKPAKRGRQATKTATPAAEASLGSKVSDFISGAVTAILGG